MLGVSRMGALRLILALSVVASHADVPSILRLWGGPSAVQIFFVISGFYMQLILRKEYRGDAVGFWMSRGARIYPAYAIVAAITVLVIFTNALMKGRFEGLTSLGPAPALLVILSNCFIVLQDAIMFTADDHGHLVFRTNADSALWPYLVILQGWSLALELYFYALAPWLARRSTTVLVVLVVASIAARIITYRIGLDYDPWTYRFFPFEIALFLTGMISQRAYSAIDWSTLPRRALLGMLAIVICGLCLSMKLAWSIDKQYSFLIAMSTAAFLPIMFLLSRKSAIDRAVGELSYPLYLTHLFVLSHISRSYFVAVPVAIGLSWLIVVFVDRPLDRWRHKKFRARNMVSVGPTSGATASAIPALNAETG
jgi:peptidoglycan/LPS O-acetylase OafA/YrhL